MHLICFSMRPTIINWLNTLVYTLYISIDSTISVSDLETTSIEVDLTSQNVDSITSTTMHSTHGTVKHIWSTFIDNCYRTDTNGFKSFDAFYHIFKDRAQYMIMGQVVLFPPTVRYIFTLFYIEESKYSLKCSVNP